MKLEAHHPEAVALYKKELMAAYRQTVFEILIAFLLLMAIHFTKHHFLYLILAIMAGKIYYSWDRLDLIKKGRTTYFKVEEWNNL